MFPRLFSPQRTPLFFFLYLWYFGYVIFVFFYIYDCDDHSIRKSMYRFFCSCVNNTIFIKCCAFHWHELELEHSVFVNYLAPFKSRKAILFVKWTAFFLPSSVWCLRQCRKYSYETLNIRTVSLFSDASTVFMENYNGTTHTHTHTTAHQETITVEQSTPRIHERNTYRRGSRWQQHQHCQKVKMMQWEVKKNEQIDG